LKSRIQGLHIDLLSRVASKKISTVDELIPEIQNNDTNYYSVTERRREELEQLNKMMNPTVGKTPATAYDPILFPTLYPPEHVATLSNSMPAYFQQQLVQPAATNSLVFHMRQIHRLRQLRHPFLMLCQPQ